MESYKIELYLDKYYDRDTKKFCIKISDVQLSENLEMIFREYLVSDRYKVELGEKEERVFFTLSDLNGLSLCFAHIMDIKEWIDELKSELYRLLDDVLYDFKERVADLAQFEGSEHIKIEKQVDKSEFEQK